MTETLTDLFCGAGGSGQGADAVPGLELRMAANHWPTAIATHQTNFPDVDHDCADISQVDPRRYPRTSEYDTVTDDLLDTRTPDTAPVLGCGAGRARPVVLDRTELSTIERADLRSVGWHVARDGRVLCPAHVAALEYLARAAVDGLPFDDPGVGS